MHQLDFAKHYRRGGHTLLAVIPAFALLVAVLSGFPARAKSSSKSEMRSVSDAISGDLEVAAFSQELTNKVQQWAQQSSARLEPLGGHQVAWSVFFFACIGGLVMVRYIPRFISINDLRTNARLAAAAAAAAHAPAHMIDEERSYAEFAARFRIGPIGVYSPPRGLDQGEAGHDKPGAPETMVHTSRDRALQPELAALPGVDYEVEPVQKFFKAAPQLLAQLRAALEKLPSDSKGMETALPGLATALTALKKASEVPELVPLWQLSTALAALLEQVTQKKRQATGSTLRTITAAIQLAEKLAQPGVPADLLADPPIRVMAVDDDPISRHAVSFALKKALNLPDLASEGETALHLATDATYDAIFLDINMPGMDGFELCKRIHETETNRDTPVVFITCQSDFESREKSVVVGACDLISKPFLTFEVALKALTLVLSARLEARKNPKPKAEVGDGTAANKPDALKEAVAA